uniref:Tyrosinase copper-binding domain-containing protein n=1 Tax=Arcella intermedia TaxID=1963864 RepID=A0A6B2L294_9EUKA
MRRAWGELSLKEQETYIRAITIAFNNHRFDEMSEVHWASINFAYAHFQSGFFLWHRWYIWKMEEYLRSLGPEFECITLTYWDWEYHNEDPTTATHVLNPHYFGTITNIPGCVTDGFFSQWTPGGECVRRTWNRNFTVVGQKDLADLITHYPLFGIDAHGFRSKFEAAPHSNVHNWLGGNMGTSFSTYDPIFYLHHSNVDRLYVMWQDCHDHEKIPQHLLGFDQYAGNLATVNGIDDIMPFSHASFFPETVTPRSLHHIHGNTMQYMEYEYSRNRYAAVVNQHNSGRCHWDLMKESVPSVRARTVRGTKKKAREDLSFLGSCEEAFVYEAHGLELVAESDRDGRFSSSDVVVGFSHEGDSDQVVGVRFMVNVPKGVRILKASVGFVAKLSSESPLFLKVYLDDELPSPSLSSKPLSARESTHKVGWTVKSAWSANSKVESPDFSSLLEGLVSSPSWVAPSPVTVLISGVQSNSPHFRRLVADKDTVTLTLYFCQDQ